MKKTLIIHPIADLTPFLTFGNLVALNIGFDKQLYVVIALKKLNYRFEHSGGASSPIIIPDEPQTYRIITLKEVEVISDILIDHERYNIHDIQPLPDDEFILVCCRSDYRGPDDFDINGRIYSYDGVLTREILLGDGIENVQSTSNGLIWTSFFDQGIYGDRGWGNPIGSTGLIAWDSQGNMKYEFKPRDGLDMISCCYALNVESDFSTWLYYYTDFPLVHLYDKRIKSHWTIPLKGSCAFAVSRGYALFQGGYDDRDSYYLFDLRNSNVAQLMSTIVLNDENDKPLLADGIIGRFNSLYIFHDQKIYRCDVEMALEA